MEPSCESGFLQGWLDDAAANSRLLHFGDRYISYLEFWGVSTEGGPVVDWVENRDRNERSAALSESNEYSELDMERESDGAACRCLARHRKAIQHDDQAMRAKLWGEALELQEKTGRYPEASMR
jgi:hypothetical protein